MTRQRAAVTGICGLACLVVACTPAPPAITQPADTQGISSTTAGAATPLMTEARGFVYRVRNAACDETGTSFAVADGIVTNRHVASGSGPTLQLSTWSGQDFDATVRSIDHVPGPDLAVLAGGSTRVPASLAGADVPDGTQVWAAGYPEGNELTLTQGIVVDYIDGSVYGVAGKVMEITNSVQPGNSGSPLLTSDGSVAGVVFATNTVTGNGLAIPASTVDQFLAAPGSDASGNCVG